MRFVKVKNFERFQHYRDRNPPWIKLYFEILSDYAFASLPDAAKFHLMGLWLLASRGNGMVPYDPKWIVNKINSTTEIDFDLLVSTGFIEICDDASTMLAPCKQNAMPSTEKEREKEKEGEKTKKGAKAPLAADAAGRDKGADPAQHEPAGQPVTAGEAKPEKPRRKRKTAPERPEHAKFRDAFLEAWLGFYGRPFPWKHGRDDAHAKWVLDQVRRELEPATEIVRRFFADDDPWLKGKPRNMGMLVSRFDRYVVDLQSDESPNGFIRAPVTQDLLDYAFGNNGDGGVL
jgi:hypothetical protein